jgi:SNF2-related domain/Helicase conserved C-terminal domain/Restriction endonuclease
MKWLLNEPAIGVQLTAEEDGVWLRVKGTRPDGVNAFTNLTPKNRLGRLLPVLIHQLVEMGLASLDPSGFRMRYVDFVELEDRGIDAFEHTISWSPYTLELETTGVPGTATFSYRYRFYIGVQALSTERMGCFLKRADEITRVDRQTFALVEAVDVFNKLPPEKKQSRDAFLCFAEIKGLAEGVGVGLDKFLSSQKVLVPSRISLDLIVDDDQRISFVPKVEGAPDEAFRKAFLAADDIEEVYALESGGGAARIRVVLDDTQREVLRRMQRVRHLGGSDRAAVLSNPYAVFDGVSNAVSIDLSAFGRRVKGVGEFPFSAQPFLQRHSHGFISDGPGDSTSGASKRERKFIPGIEFKSAGGVGRIQFRSKAEFRKFRQEILAARENGRQTVVFEGKEINVEESIVRAVEELAKQVFPNKDASPPLSKDARKFLLIFTNEDQVEYDEAVPDEKELSEFKLPKSVLANDLKSHQREGVRWLQYMFDSDRHGCLLADDMGLGKTLQILMFVASLIEKGELSRDSTDPESAPWNPVLIIMPLVLLENDTWLKDARSFFKSNGNCFQPTLMLYGDKLKQIRRPGMVGKEIALGEPVLDLDKLRRYRIILTNYDTIVNYQHSFARMKEHLTAVITDEAQEHKTPNTRISHALKSLSPRFRISATGTPVETRLLDVWNIFDYLQPGNLLGSSSDFRDRYEAVLERDRLVEGPRVLQGLKNRLRFGRPDAFLLRREKSELKDLPKKHEHRLVAPLSAKQRIGHLDIVSQARSDTSGRHAFSLLHELVQLYQHPSLIPVYMPPSPVEALEQCPKLVAVVDALKRVQSKGEKAIIFTRYHNMQDLLKRVLDDSFQLDVRFINGQSRQSQDTLNVFKNRSGFDILILSPEVAGLGLTIVEANHVIHYGRWWNPAKESQATDRVYRIGQKRDVHVYYPIACDPENRFKTFDERLDELLRSRRDLARDFLSPLPNESDLEKDIFQDVFATSPASAHSREVPAIKPEDIKLLTWDRFEALLALLERKQGGYVILTPRSGDGKVDVLAFRKAEIRLIQCKHSSSESQLGAEALDEVSLAFDGYRARRMPSLPSSVTVRLIVATNGAVSRDVRREAVTRNIELLGQDTLVKLLDQHKCTYAEVEVLESSRLETMRDVQAAINLQLSKLSK